MRQRKKQNTVQRRSARIAVIFAAAAVLAAAAAWAVLARPFDPEKPCTLQTQAVVREVEIRREPASDMLLYYPVYETIVDGTKYILHPASGYSFNPVQIGEEIMLSLDPANPFHFAVTSEMGLSRTELITGWALSILSVLSFMSFAGWLLLHYKELHGAPEPDAAQAAAAASLPPQDDGGNQAVFDLSDMPDRDFSESASAAAAEAAAKNGGTDSAAEERADVQASATASAEAGSAQLLAAARAAEQLRRDMLYQDEYITETVSAAFRLYADNNRWTEGFMTTTGKASLFVPFKQGITNGAVFTSVEFDGGRTLYVDIYPRGSGEPQITIEGFGIRQEHCTKLIEKILSDLDRLESITLADDYALSIDLSD